MKEANNWGKLNEMGKHLHPAVGRNGQIGIVILNVTISSEINFSGT